MKIVNVLSLVIDSRAFSSNVIMHGSTQANVMSSFFLEVIVADTYFAGLL